MPNPLAADPTRDDTHAPVRDALAAVLAPLARLALSQGVSYAALDELLRTALVAAARDAQPEVMPHRSVSRISAATGLNRREVGRLLHAERPKLPPPSPVSMLVTRWWGDPACLGADGRPRALPRQGAAPSFEALAQAVTKDVHPRSLLEALCRMGLAEQDSATDHVTLLRDRVVPAQDAGRLFGLLGANVGDHLAAAVANVQSETPQHLEQALFGGGVSAATAAALRPLVAAQWQSVLRTLGPQIEQLMDADRDSDAPKDQRLRVGLYSYTSHQDTP